jgi:hypothetical protein
MKLTHTLLATTLACLTAFLTVALPAQAAPCSVDIVAGTYGYTFSGFVNNPAGLLPAPFLPAAAAGRIAFHKDGTVTGIQTRVVAGSALDEEYSGTYTVNADCTGSFTVNVTPDTRTSTVKVVWNDNAKGSTAVFATPGFTMTGISKRIGPED